MLKRKLYSVIIFTGDKNIGNNGFVKWRAVNNLKKVEISIIKHYPLSKFATIYDKETRQKVRLITF